ncbi:MAG TPA: FecR family protein [Usitatibacter sp.]|nr:FecR family protein [Usitatibacter sp.]
MNSARTLGARLWLLVALALACLDAGAQAVGRVLIAAGEVVAMRAGREVPLASGADVLSGDLIRTGEASSAQLRFSDETLVALRAKSRFHVADYRFGGADDGASTAVFALLQGGLRTITGLIGRGKPERYRMTTPLATLGIRGTAYALVHCQGDCEEDGVLAPDGTYGLIFEGRVTVANAAGEREFREEDAFFVADANTLPQLLLDRPRLLRDRQEARARRDERRDEARAQAAARRELLARIALLPNRFDAFDARAVGMAGTAASPILVTELQDGSGNIALLGPGLGAGVGFSTAAAAVGLVDGGRGTVIQLDGTRGVLDRFSFNAGQEQGDRGDARVLDNGRLEGDGGAVWGRWAPGAFVRIGDATAAPATGVHFFFGNLTPEALFGAVPPGLPSVRYEYAGGPRPTDERGNVGQFIDGAFVVNFIERSIGGHLNYRVDTLTYNLPVPQGTALRFGRGFAGFNVVGVGTGHWSCSCNNTSGALGHYSVSGLFLGSRAQGIGVTFGTQDPIAGRTAGAGIFRCVSGRCR